MARKIIEIKQSITDKIAADPVLSAMLTSTSTVSLFGLYSYIVAFAAWVIEMLQDQLKSDINETVAAMKPHSLRWYAEKAKAFQYGYDLPYGSDTYDNTGLDPDLVAASKIVTYAAVVEQIRGVRIKVATTFNGDLTQLNNDQMASFIAYMLIIKDAGVKLNITTGLADLLHSALRIIYDPLVLNTNGSRIDGTNTDPVKLAIKTFLLNLPFNGVFSIQKFVDAIQAVDGVLDLNVDQISSKYGLLNFKTIDISADLIKTYLPAE
jgi:hypothetical protein